jgi:hypothetical protein
MAMFGLKPSPDAHFRQRGSIRTAAPHSAPAAPPVSMIGQQRNCGRFINAETPLRSLETRPCSPESTGRNDR